MNRTFGGDLHQLRMLFRGQRPGQFDFDVDPVEHAILRFAFFAVARMNTRMPQGNTDFVERPVISTRVKADRHGGANAKTRQQIIVRIGSSVAPACAGRFIGDKAMFTRNDLLSEAARTAVDDNVGRFVALLCIHVQIKGAKSLRSDRDMTKPGRAPVQWR